MAAADELQARVNFSALSLGQDTCTPAPAQDDQSPLTLSGLQNVPSRNSVDSAATTARDSVLFIGTYFNHYTTVDTLLRREFNKVSTALFSSNPGSPHSILLVGLKLLCFGLADLLTICPISPEHQRRQSDISAAHPEPM